MKRRILSKLLACRADKQAVALVTHLESGMQCLVFADGTTDQCDQQQFELAAGIVDRARQSLEEQRSAAAEMEDARYMIRAYVPLPRLFVVGAVHIAQALLPMAGLAGFQVHPGTRGELLSNGFCRRLVARGMSTSELLRLLHFQHALRARRRQAASLESLLTGFFQGPQSALVR